MRSSVLPAGVSPMSSLELVDRRVRPAQSSDANCDDDTARGHQRPPVPITAVDDDRESNDGRSQGLEDHQDDRDGALSLQRQALSHQGGFRCLAAHIRSIATCVARLHLLRRVLAEFNEAGFDLLRFFFQADLRIAHGESAPDADAAQPRIVMRVPDLAKASAQSLDLVALVVGYADSVLKPERGTDV